ncbi:uncharacterized protein LOC123450920 [Hordeum vulgare subsp. vulgare]|uniref:Uncharacterized protein n=1 Tax=Hordeum vulgare subsp. vulgare TaxID=112509 RepID=A0A8I6WZI4_HORVV|nr:uncharacterized protein LOC123450920 [Hordeum vulgare subsp. vulgare]
MAAGNQRKRLFVVMKDKKPDYFVYGINIEHMFQSGPSRGAAIEIRSLPSPMGQIPKPLADPERVDFALAGDGATLVGVSNLKRTVLYDTRSGATSTGPELQHDKTGGTFVVPLGRRLYALKCRLNRSDQGKPSGEDCTLLIQDAGGTRLRLDCSSSSWRTLPEPPPDFRSLNGFQIKCQLTAYFTAGARIWVSAEKRGTYSFHTVRRQWRKEGDWQLPFHHRAVFVPELDNLCFGLSSKDRCLVAVDVRQSPPVVRYNWEDTFPAWARDNGNLCGLMPEGSLVYLGDGRFCIAWTVLMIDNVDGRTHYFLHLMAVQLIKTSSTGSGKKHLRMVKRGVCCYEMPSHGLMAHVF